MLTRIARFGISRPCFDRCARQPESLCTASWSAVITNHVSALSGGLLPIFLLLQLTDDSDLQLELRCFEAKSLKPDSDKYA